MRTCPPEIHGYIFSLACSDDGYTGRSLSSVSRYVRLVSAPYQWHNIVLAGLPQVQRFATTLEAFSTTSSLCTFRPQPDVSLVSPCGKRPIYHIFLSNRTAALARDIRNQERRETSHFSENIRRRPSFDSEAAKFARAVHQILVYASPSIRTLTLLCYDVHLLPTPRGGLSWRSIFGTGQGMPKLEDLTVRGGFNEGDLRDFGHSELTREYGHGATISGSTDGGVLDVELENSRGPPIEQQSAITAALLPSLKRLHLISPIPFELFLYRLQSLVPALSHLRLSDLQATNYALARAIFSELAERDIVPSKLNLHDRQWLATHKAQPIEWAPILPTADVLQKLILQPCALPPKPERPCGCCSAYYQIDDMTRLLEEMACEAEGDTFVYVPAGHQAVHGGRARTLGEDYSGFDYEEALHSWRERAQGFDGFWSL